MWRERPVVSEEPWIPHVLIFILYHGAKGETGKTKLFLLNYQSTQVISVHVVTVNGENDDGNS